MTFSFTIPIELINLAYVAAGVVVLFYFTVLLARLFSLAMALVLPEEF